MKNLQKYINHLLARGIYCFSKQDALKLLDLEESQLRFQAYRLSKKGFLKRLGQDFFMIIPPEFVHLESLPPQWIIDQLMKHLEQEYYIGLLSAAAFYGATEQQPMMFQVITTKSHKQINFGRSALTFYNFKHCNAAAKTMLKTPAGYAQIATREQTVVDLVRFYESAGYFSNIALVIKRLIEELDVAAFTLVIQQEETKTVLQRLGYLLELLDASKFTEIVAQALTQQQIQYTPLRPDLKDQHGKQNSRWKLIINDAFRNDITPLLSMRSQPFDPDVAYQLVRTELIDRL